MAARKVTPDTLFLLQSTKLGVPKEVYWGTTSDLRKKTLHLNRKFHRPSLPIPKSVFRSLAWRPLLAVTGLTPTQLPALLYKINAGVAGVPRDLQRSGPQRDPVLYRLAAICRALNEPWTWDPTLFAYKNRALLTAGEAERAEASVGTAVLQDVTCHWADERAAEVPGKLGLAWGPQVLHQRLTWEGILKANGRAPAVGPLTEAERLALRARIGRNAANSVEYWRNYRQRMNE